jgi:DNA (cytosine-5)-methyltransferase 1
MNCIDIFAGVSGLSEGFTRQGFNPIAHVEMDENACYSIKTRITYHHLKEQDKLNTYNEYLTQAIDRETLYSHLPDHLLKSVINEKITQENIKDIFKQIDELRDGKEATLLLGGPPCQAYSLVGRSRMGKNNVVHDERYHLYRLYGEFLDHFKPKAFVFENVMGLMSASGGQLIKDIENLFASYGYKIAYKVLNASDYGVLQHRKRVIIIGIKGKAAFDFPEIEQVDTNFFSVQNSIFKDLPVIKQGYDNLTPLKYRSKKANEYLQSSEIRNGVDYVTQHVTRQHNTRDLEIYGIAIDKWLNNRERLKYNDLPKKLQTHNNTTAFLDRYKVVDTHRSHTVVAHLAKDGHYFIYPDAGNVRSISVREAARIQSFPDNFYFEGGRSAAFKQIGNAVPPLMAEKIALALTKIL